MTSPNKVMRISVGMLETNCYLIEAGDILYIIDPGGDADRIKESAAGFHASKAVILLTHGHFDHIGAVANLQRELKAFCYLNTLDKELSLSRENCYMPYIPPLNEHPASSGNFDFAPIELILTPGHTPGGVCFYFRNDGILFSGDTLFASSIGRSDFPGGDHQLLINSIKQKLWALPDETIVYPGHGPATTIGREKRVNPYLK